MTDRNELERLQPMTTEEKALALMNAVRAERNWPISKRIRRGVYSYDEALCRAIEAHEADKRAFSDTLREVHEKTSWEIHPSLWRFIIPDPEPDPLVEALDKMLRRRTMHPDREVLADEAAFLTAELAARGWKMNLERIEQ